MSVVRERPGTCPVAEGYEAGPAPGPALGQFNRMDAWRAQSRPALWAEDGPGFWVFTDHAVILDGLQSPDLWSSKILVPNEPNPPYKWIPIMLDPPEHATWRHLLASYFAPGRVRPMEDDQRRLAADLIESFQARGECDFVSEFAQVFPTSIFVQIMGMPTAKLREFMEWEHMILHQNSLSDPDQSIRANGMMNVVGYFSELIAERRADHAPEAPDIVSQALTWQIDGQAVKDEDLLNCFLLLFMAGLDTVASQLSYAFLHLARHPEDRQRIVDDPSAIPHAVEELLRAYPIVQTGRIATRDADFHGCPVRAGDTAAFPLSMAGRDDQAFPDATHVDFAREDVRHFSFGAGPHRCLGSHLARQELVVALQEWHKRIPSYEAVGEPSENRSGVYGLTDLTLRWAT